MSFTGFLGDVLGGALKNDNLRDYQHASRTFRSGNYKLLPKFKNQWYISFEFNSAALNILTDLFDEIGAGQGSSVYRISSGDITDKVTISVLAKTVKLPSYRFDVKRYNQYNKQFLSVNKIQYEPVSIEFHDDSLNVVRGWWDAYYMYYVQDSRYRNYATMTGSTQGLKVPSQWDKQGKNSLYGAQFDQHWGVDTVQQQSDNGQSLDRIVDFFESIKIYHFSRPVAAGTEEDGFPHYAEYTLVNPVISAFEHDTLETSSSEPTANRMSIEYETVLYAQGKIDENLENLATFKKIHSTYRDRAKSPLQSPTASLLGGTGLLNTATGLISGLQGGTVSPLQAALTVGKTVATWKQSGGVTGLLNSVSQEAKTVINSSLTEIQQNAQSGNQTITVPTAISSVKTTTNSLLKTLRR